MKKLLIVLFLCVTTVGITMWALEWPAAPTQLITTFGANERGFPHLGISFDTSNDILSSGNGELIFNSETKLSRFISPLGTWKAIDHGEGLISIYSRFAPDNDSAALTTVQSGTVIGSAGRSGWSQRQGFHFSLYDRKGRHWSNPSLLLPPVADTQAPIIQSVRLRNQAGTFFELLPMRRIPQGSYAIVVNASDTVDQNTRLLTPISIRCFVNGTEIGVLTFETIFEQDGILMIQQHVPTPLATVYAPFPSFEIAQYRFDRGLATIEVLARDMQGGTRNVTFTVIIE
ncbi:MAG: M23 family metallopeptidase [Treponema sp.]|jgi:murein DD-endopeptidase MepM/ murein hydrolase activator NlpD|nr:M23 family metallopeptidase [Treponema sp.]